MDAIRLISLDLDGTLLDSNRKMPEKNREALQKASENGIHIVISTGSPYDLMPHEDLKGIDISYAITANGSAIYEYKTRNCIYENSIATNDILPILEFLLTKDMHIDMFIQGKAYCPAHTRAIVDKLDVPKSRSEYIRHNRVWLEDTLSFIKENQLTMQKITMNFYPDETGTLVDREDVKQYLQHNSLIHLAVSGWGNLEITKKGVNKGNSLKKLCEVMDLPISATLAMGDSVNDLDIVKMAGIGVAMGNAMPELIQAADFVTSTNDQMGVAETIYQLLQKGI